MFKNYLKVTFRIFKKEKVFSLINLFGLVLGFTCCLLIFLFVQDELSYDNFHQDEDRIYRVAAAYMREGRWEPYATNSWPTAELLKTNFGEIEALVRIRRRQDIVEYKEKRVSEERLATVEENFLEVFSFELVAGNRQEALKGSNKVVITESIARKYFENEDPMGKIFEMNDGQFQLMVTGVMRDMPPNSHFHFDFLISGETARSIAPPALFTNIGFDSQWVYIKASKNFNPELMEAEFPRFIDDHLSAVFTSANFKLFLQPLLDIHLKSDLGLEIEANGNIDHLYIFSVIAIFTLLIACINYMNLTTARSVRRAREVGMRKVLGAGRSHLVNQFLSESFMMTFLAILFSLALTFLILPAFNAFSGKEISRSFLFSYEVIAAAIILLIAVGLLAGTYPSFILSSFKPLNTLKGRYISGNSGVILRKGLVILQFGISIGLIVATGITYKQLQFLRNKDLGINKDLLVAVPMRTMDRSQLETVKNDLLANAAVKSVGTCNMKLPGWISNSTYYEAEGVPIDQEARKSMKIIRVDPDFFESVEGEFIAGRNFSKSITTDLSEAVILNEAAVSQLGWREPIGSWLKLGRRKRTTIGIVKDFHFESLHRRIPPTVFVLSDSFLNWIYVKIAPDNIPTSLDHIEKVYSKFVKDRDFIYSFIDEDVRNQYNAEDKFMKIFIIFTLLAVAIACLGIFGLVSFMAERKSKEIGIRKVLGASVGGVSFLLIKEFIFLLLVASTISWPFTYYFMNGWLTEFIYRTSISIDLFFVATLLALLIAICSTGFKALAAALTNPVNALRDE